MPPFTILMLIFSAAILLYAGLLALTKDYTMLPFRARVSVKPKNPKKYTVQLAKAVAVAGLVPALAGLAGIWSGIAAGVVFVVGLIAALWLSTKIVKDEA